MNDSPQVTYPGPLRIAIIIGSIREDRFGTIPARWIADHARKLDGLDVDLVDLADYDCPMVLSGDDHDAVAPESVQQLSERLNSADAFIVVTPVYNRSYPASLKSAIDWIYEEWQLKPVGLMSYGGITGGLQAIEHLRDVFKEFNAVTLRDTIIFPNCWDKFDDDGLPTDPELATKLATGFLDQITWWANTLRQGRNRQPYPGGIEL